MKDQSQIDEMRATIRAEWERGKARPRPSPVVQPDIAAEQEPPAAETPRPGLLSSLFKRS